MLGKCFTGKLEQVLDMQMTTISDMQVGDLIIEIDLQELSPKVQPCLLTEHEVAGQTFHLVKGREYIMIVNLFREGGNMPNPIKRVNKLTVYTADGLPLELLPNPTPARSKKPLPNCETVSALFNAADCRAPLMSTATKWPDYRTVDLEISLELNSVQGKDVLLMPALYFQVHATESIALKALQAKNWAEDRYMKLAPSTRKMLKGMIVVAKMATKAAVGV